MKWKVDTVHVQFWKWALFDPYAPSVITSGESFNIFKINE